MSKKFTSSVIRLVALSSSTNSFTGLNDEQSLRASFQASSKTEGLKAHLKISPELKAMKLVSS